MRIIVFAPHNDDEVLGVGGTIAKYSASGHEVFICEVTKGDSDEMVNMIRSEALNAHKILGVKETIFLDFPVVQLRETPLKDINFELLKVVEHIKPNIAFIPHKGDMHIDHAVVSNSAMVALRPINSVNVNAIYAYETLSETEWNIPTVDNAFIPNVWSNITGFIDKKKQAMNCYKSQIKEPPHPRSNEIIEALAKLRGSTIGVAYAESFMLVRETL
ncbi:PIG-L deacetylase family protein [Tepidanaerobacter syntrophicus]|uniref:N-acetylglucosaminyl deacetylase, LmbE family n=1 Tax=Tepidanaerobacter syntrophicus TaxID=224999 RepID=A0A0U9HD30_9FIRM|nr:PIG-L deacetylase family protein [Tepidanaerobacter syntrophicus]GAQ24573.1 N-acetylglucosaminyl deacetylase, LmbE family [Tepidanaerobacter syntrophicus]GLI19851.1 PIG-L domain-containing protein [Tepidanaerobacter syntrophicus]